MTQFIPEEYLSPIIVVGMHRSGTTLLVQLLEGCGVFMGAQQTGNRESIFFQNINREALDFFGCSWRCLDFLPSADHLGSRCGSVIKFIERRLDDSLLSGHFGSTFVQNGQERVLWGWKDPRNSLLLPVWRQVFPNARVINIYRDGRDVALSLLKRQKKIENAGDEFTADENVNRYRSNFSLWAAYIGRIRESLGLFNGNFTLQYETLLENPESEIEKLLRALNISPVNSLEMLISVVDGTRANRHGKNDYSWTTDVDIEQSLLRDLGYS
jgi:hypothetical protein